MSCIEMESDQTNPLNQSKIAEKLLDGKNVEAFSQEMQTLSSKDYYFNSYSHFGIHEEMIKDEVRTGTYRSAILENPHLFKDKTVLDVGCGTGILSLFCAQAGAKHVYGVDYSNIAEAAREIVKANKMDEKITIIQGKVEEIELPVDKVDIIVSEWMGYCLLYEAMLDTVLVARDKFLKEDGMLFPDKCTIFLTAIEDRANRHHKVNWWNKVHGYDMSVMRKQVLKEPIVESCNYRSVCTSTHRLIEFDLYTMTIADKSFQRDFHLKALRDDHLTAIVAYFSVEFTKCHTPTGFFTGCRDQHTHWKQTLFYLKRPINLKRHEVVRGKFFCRPGAQNNRNLEMKIDISFKGANDHYKDEQEFVMQ